MKQNTQSRNGGGMFELLFFCLNLLISATVENEPTDGSLS
jgi:hypothetical protein